MVLITGGRYQGKQAFAAEMAEKKEHGFLRCGGPGGVADGRFDEPEQMFNAELILHMESFIRREMEQGGEPELLIRRLLKENCEAVVVADEIGSGIVPVDPFERGYRETAGRMCQKLAADSDRVYRVVCGIGVRIK